MRGFVAQFLLPNYIFSFHEPNFRAKDTANSPPKVGPIFSSVSGENLNFFSENQPNSQSYTGGAFKQYLCKLTLRHFKTGTRIACHILNSGFIIICYYYLIFWHNMHFFHSVCKSINNVCQIRKPCKFLLQYTVSVLCTHINKAVNK